MGEMLGLAPGALPVMNEYGRVSDLARALRTIHEVEGLLDYDINIFEQTPPRVRVDRLRHVAMPARVARS